MTVDVDVVHQRTDENIGALLDALATLDAHFRGHPDKRLEPTREHLATTEHQLLTTNCGPLDLLGAIEHGLTYEQLLSDSLDIRLEERSIRVLSLAKYVVLTAGSTWVVPARTGRGGQGAVTRRCRSIVEEPQHSHRRSAPPRAPA